MEVELDGKKTVYGAKNVIIATGSRPRSLPFLEIDGKSIWSSDDALFIKSAPKSVAVVGAGAIGMEFADVFEAFGSEVTVIEAIDRVLPLEDEEVSAHVAKSYRRRGMTVHTGARIESAKPERMASLSSSPTRKERRRRSPSRRCSQPSGGSPTRRTSVSLQ